MVGGRMFQVVAEEAAEVAPVGMHSGGDRN